MSLTGAGRAEAVSPIPLSAISEIALKDPEPAREYLGGYMGVVERELLGVGISDPIELGIHVSIKHIVTQDPNMEGTAGIEGFNDGMQVVKPRVIHEQVGTSAKNHYKDGVTVGFEFRKSQLRKGRFNSLAPLKEIPEAKIEALKDEIGIWMRDNDVRGITPELVLFLHPYARLGLAYFHNAKGVELNGYLQEIEHRLRTNPDNSHESILSKLEAIKKGYSKAKLWQESSKTPALTAE